jgi:hypothetical protein
VRRGLQFHKRNQGWYEGRKPASDVLVLAPTQAEEAYGNRGPELAQAAFRGVYRALAESHLPFDVLPDSRLAEAQADGRLGRYKAVVLPNCAALSEAQTAILDGYVDAGGGLVATFETATRDAAGTPNAEGQIALKSLGAGRVLARRDGDREMRGSYLRVTDRADLADLPETDVVAIDRAFLYVEARDGATPSFTLIGPSRYGPPEKCWWDDELETDHPGLLWQRHGRGRTAYFPWQVDTLFYGHSLPEYRSLLAHAVASVAGGRQIETDLPPVVEVTVDVQPSSGATLVHLVNGSGHQDRSYFEPAAFEGRTLSVRTAGAVRAVTAGSNGAAVPFEQADGAVRLRLPRLELLELLVLEV